jgi:GTP-binding protein Era
MEDSDIILFVIQRLTLDEQDLSILKKLKSIDTKVICVVNKVDQVTDKNKLLPLIQRLSDEHNFLDIIPISAINNDGIGELEALIKKYLPENEHLYGKNLEPNSHKDLFMISELVREKIIRMLGDELPHDTFVQVELFEEQEALIKIHAVIFVARNSQKQIVIGKGGNTLKKIGQQARIEIEEYFNKKVFLKTWVKVKKNWNTDSDYLQSLGVGGSYD